MSTSDDSMKRGEKGDTLLDIKGLRIYEGSSHIQRIVIARHLLGPDDAEPIVGLG